MLKSLKKEIVCDISGKVRKLQKQNGLNDYLVMKLNQPPNNFINAIKLLKRDHGKYSMKLVTKLEKFLSCYNRIKNRRRHNGKSITVLQ